jgi:hypothetical protein
LKPIVRLVYEEAAVRQRLRVQPARFLIVFDEQDSAP